MVRLSLREVCRGRMRKFGSEFFGTFCLVFAGTGAIIVNDITGGAITHVGVSLIFGLIVLAMIYTLGDVSGAHLNPAVTLGFLIMGRFEKRSVLPYISGQLLGAIAASGTLHFLFPDHKTLGATLPAGSIGQSFILEMLLTLILMFVILSVSAGAKEKGITAGIAVGAVIALEAMLAGPISGASMNPVRSVAPALLSGNLTGLWIYLLAPPLGAILSVPLFSCLRGKDYCG